MALGLTLGIILAVSGGGNATTIQQSALGNCASPSASASASAAAAAASPAASASASPCPSGSAGATTPTTVAPANSFARGPIAFRQLGNVATAPVDAAGNAINLNQNADQAAQSTNCTIQVPANPLTAQGLATPWQLGDACSMANAGTQGAFVEATILSPGGKLQVYNPLVITAGTTPAVAPTPPTIPRGSQVIINVGFNGNALALTGPGATQGRCVDALGQSLIGQVSACNAVNFFRLANAEIAWGILKIPATGTAADGQPCLNVRSFPAIDQDQSDNVVSQYLLTADGKTAQATAANMANLNGATLLSNGSDTALVNRFLDPATGCTPFTVPNPTSPTGASASQALSELSARVNQHGTIAVVPPNDPMALVNGQMSIAKTNVYRSLVDQPLLGNVNPATVAAAYCQNMVNLQPARSQLDMARELNFNSPVADVGNNLATFMGARLDASFTNLNCQNFGLTSPVKVTLDGNGVATAVTYNLNQQQATGAGGQAAQPGAGGDDPVKQNPFMRRHRHHSAGD